MENSEFLWQGLLVLSTIGNALQGWARLKDRGKAQAVRVEEQPLEVVKGKAPATMEHVKALHYRIDGVEMRVNAAVSKHDKDKQDIIEEVIKMREQSANQFTELNRAIGRLEGSLLGKD